MKAIARHIVRTRCARPLAAVRLQAGFPSPADDYMETALDLNEYMIDNPPATFFVRVTGESMTGAGIFPDDLLVVDRSVTAHNGDIVVAVLDGEFTVKRLIRRAGRVDLVAENPNFPPIRITGESDLQIWGVVRHVIRSF